MRAAEGRGGRRRRTRGGSKEPGKGSEEVGRR